MKSRFRNHLYPRDHPRLASVRRHDAASYADSLCSAPVVADLIGDWLEMFENTAFVGITTDGNVIPELFEIGDESPPTAAAVIAAQDLLAALPSDARERLTHPIDSKVWRAWMNPEFYVNRFGLRLEETQPKVRQLVLGLLQASLSPEGFQKARNIMYSNEFLGHVVGLPAILNENSYNINLFGTPSMDRPWGWNLYGHHLCLNSLFIGAQQVLTPAFFGAEPTEIDAGEHRGTTLFCDEERAALEFVRTLPQHLADRATLYRHKRDALLPPGRLHIADELHLGGAFQDNRVVPYEGLVLADCAAEARDKILRLAGLFLRYQPAGPRAARMAAVAEHLDDTWFCWIGGVGDDDPFYFRLQSPVIMIEFDHHAGIFLANPQPERFHVHTIVRTPNGNDYGSALIAQATGIPHRLKGPA